jgi:hypothetical protein
MRQVWSHEGCNGNDGGCHFRKFHLGAPASRRQTGSQPGARTKPLTRRPRFCGAKGSR